MITSSPYKEAYIKYYIKIMLEHYSSLYLYGFKIILQKWETCETRLADQAQRLEEVRARLKQSIPDQQEEMEEERLLVKVH